MSLTICGIGTALPPHTMTQDEAAELARRVNLPADTQAAVLRALYRRAGVKRAEAFQRVVPAVVETL